MTLRLALPRAGLLAASTLIASIALGADPAHATCSPNQGDKYSGLIKRLYVPQDTGRYGNCRDYGYWSGTSYAGQSIPRRGFWVYAAPYWYVWAYSGQPKPSNTYTGCSPSQGNKYSVPMHRIYKPDSYRTRGGCYDYGYWSGTSYAGVSVRPGYWVFAYPYWHVWQRRNN